MAQASPRARPAPLKVAVPLAATWPPDTVKTVWIALTNPLKLVMALAGRTIRMISGTLPADVGVSGRRRAPLNRWPAGSAAR